MAPTVCLEDIPVAMCARRADNVSVLMFASSGNAFRRVRKTNNSSYIRKRRHLTLYRHDSNARELRRFPESGYENSRVCPSPIECSIVSSSSGCYSSEGDSSPASPTAAILNSHQMADDDDTRYCGYENDDGFLNGSCASPKIRFVKSKRDGLLEIALRTVALIRKNQLLQQKLATLQAETRAFVKSVLNNPENKKFVVNKKCFLKRSYSNQDNSVSTVNTDLC